MPSHLHITVHIPGLDVGENLVHYVTDFVSCSIRPLEDVLVEVHDEVDGARYFHVDVAVTEQQHMSIVWHNVSVLCTSSTVVYVFSVICVCSVHNGLRKLLSTSTFVIPARLHVMVYHVPKHEFAITLVICFGRHGRNLGATQCRRSRRTCEVVESHGKPGEHEAGLASETPRRTSGRLFDRASLSSEHPLGVSTWL